MVCDELIDTSMADEIARVEDELGLLGGGGGVDFARDGQIVAGVAEYDNLEGVRCGWVGAGILVQCLIAVLVVI